MGALFVSQKKRGFPSPLFCNFGFWVFAGSLFFIFDFCSGGGREGECRISIISNEAWILTCLGSNPNAWRIEKSISGYTTSEVFFLGDKVEYFLTPKYKVWGLTTGVGVGFLPAKLGPLRINVIYKFLWSSLNKDGFNELCNSIKNPGKFLLSIICLGIKTC